MDPYRQVVLAARPKGLPRAGDFRLEAGPMPEPLEGQDLVATKFLSLDPYMRGRMNDAESYAPPVNVGGVMEGRSSPRSSVRGIHPLAEESLYRGGSAGAHTRRSHRETCKGWRPGLTPLRPHWVSWECPGSLPMQAFRPSGNPNQEKQWSSRPRQAQLDPSSANWPN